jgi:hypothetical protein
MADTITALTDLETFEVSVVKRGANKRKFALTKSEKQMPQKEMNEVLKSLVESGEIEDVAKVDAVAKAAKLSEKSAAALAAVAKIADGFKDDPAVKLALAKLFGKDEADDEEEDAEDAKKAKKKAAAKKSDDAGNGEDKETPVTKTEFPPEMQAILKANEEAIKKAQEENTRLAEVIKKERDEREVKEWVAKSAADLRYIPGQSAEQLGRVLKELQDKNGLEMANKHFDMLKASSALVSKSAMFREHGAGGAGASDASGSAWDRIKKLADSIVVKDAKLTGAKAVQMVLKAHPELYAEYKAEHPRQFE